MASEYTLPKAGEHVIGYASPGSDTARALHQDRHGCYVVWLVGEMHAHASYDACVAQVQALGTRPGRWSSDHPWNQQFYPEHDSAEARVWHERLQAEEADRAAAATRTQALRAAGGRVEIALDTTPFRTIVTETMRGADGFGLAARNAGELWGVL